MSFPHNDQISFTDASDFRDFLLAHKQDEWLNAACEWFRTRGDVYMIQIPDDPQKDEADVADWIEWEFRASDHPLVKSAMKENVKPHDIWTEDELSSEVKAIRRNDMYATMRDIQQIAWNFKAVEWRKLKKDEVVQRALSAYAQLIRIANELAKSAEKYEGDNPLEKKP